MNKVIVHGRICKDPETRQAGSGTVCKFSVAENQRYDREKSNFHDCEAWGKTGEFVQKYFRKGSEIVVSGELRQEEWAAQDGSKRRAWKINVDAVDFCGKASDNSGGAAPGEQAGTTPGMTELDPDDDLPF